MTINCCLFACNGGRGRVGGRERGGGGGRRGSEGEREVSVKENVRLPCHQRQSFHSHMSLVPALHRVLETTKNSHALL